MYIFWLQSYTISKSLPVPGWFFLPSNPRVYLDCDWKAFPSFWPVEPLSFIQDSAKGTTFFFSRKQTLSSKMPSVWFPVLTRIIKLLYRIQLFLYLEFLGPSPVYRWVIRLLGRWSESQKWAECAVQSRAFTIQDQQRNILPIQSSLWCSHCYGLAHIRLLLDPGLLPR